MVIKKYFSELIEGNLVKGGVIMLAGSVLVNFLNYLFYPLMARFLTPIDYASLIAVTSIINFISVPTISLNAVVTKFTASYVAGEQAGKIKSLFKRLTKLILLTGVLLGVILILLSPYLLNFLHINNPTVPYVLALVLVINLIITIPYGILQGLLKFHLFVIGNLVASASRLIFAAGLSVLGYGLTGSLIGILLGLSMAYVVTLIPLRQILTTQGHEERAKLREVFWYSLPTVVVVLGLTAMVTTDILLVNHFLKDQAGVYALGNVLGRIIIFSAYPVTTVMFPIISQRLAAKKAFWNVFYLGLGLVLAIGAGVSLIYWLVPHLVLIPIGKGNYDEVLPLMVSFGIFAALQAVAIYLSYFNLALKRLMITAWLVFGAACVQLAALWYIHNDLTEVIMVNIWVSLALVVGLALMSLRPINSKNA